MSRHPRVAQPASSVTARLVSVAAEVGASVRAARLRRRWTTGRLASEAGTSRTLVYLVERGEPTTLQTYARLATALGLRLEVDLRDPRQRHVPPRAEDPVHAAIVEGLAARYASQGRLVAVDEPYQHFQFAGRADLAVVDPAGPALLHHEVKTAIPNVGEMAGSWNAKRRYLAMVLAERHGLRGGFRSVAHVLTLAWTADCLHVIRLRGATLRALGPDGPAAFAAWWDGEPPPPGVSATVVLLDPLERRRAPAWAGTDDLERLRPRHRTYADLLEELRRAGRA